MARHKPGASAPQPGEVGTPAGQAGQPLDQERTVELLARFRAGDARALDVVLARCLPALRRWAHGRLPPIARDLVDTGDLVQETVLRALGRLESFDCRGEGALQADLRQALANRIRDELRRTTRRPPASPLADGVIAPTSSPLEEAIGRETLDRYEEALARLTPHDREAIIARVELHYSYADLAVALGKETPDAARVAVSRALVRLAEEMDRGT